ncbi:MAG TPA: hypothetical protein VKE40_08225 [Gemmataceae bacterium]|nr:hypothetical protein [Gemmataceae bacterium]
MVVLTLSGCSESTGGKLVQVKGKVFVGSQPLGGGSVSFRPQETGSNPGPEPYGTIESDGTYTMYTNQKPGAPVGKYFALVVATEEADSTGTTVTPKSLIDPKYADPDSKRLPIEVVENAAPGQYDLKLAK